MAKFNVSLSGLQSTALAAVAPGFATRLPSGSSCRWNCRLSPGRYLDESSRVSCCFRALARACRACRCRKLFFAPLVMSKTEFVLLRIHLIQARPLPDAGIQENEVCCLRCRDAVNALCRAAGSLGTGKWVAGELADTPRSVTGEQAMREQSRESRVESQEAGPATPLLQIFYPPCRITQRPLALGRETRHRATTPGSSAQQIPRHPLDPFFSSRPGPRGTGPGRARTSTGAGGPKSLSRALDGGSGSRSREHHAICAAGGLGCGHEAFDGSRTKLASWPIVRLARRPGGRR